MSILPPILSIVLALSVAAGFPLAGGMAQADDSACPLAAKAKASTDDCCNTTNDGEAASCDSACPVGAPFGIAVPAAPVRSALVQSQAASSPIQMLRGFALAPDTAPPKFS